MKAIRDIVPDVVPLGGRKNFIYIIVLIKFVDQDIEFLSCFLYIRQPVEFFNAIYIYIYIYI